MTQKEHTEQSPWGSTSESGRSFQLSAASQVKQRRQEEEKNQVRKGAHWSSWSMSLGLIPWVSSPGSHPMRVSILCQRVQSCLRLYVCLRLGSPYGSHRTSKGSNPQGTDVWRQRWMWVILSSDRCSLSGL